MRLGENHMTEIHHSFIYPRKGRTKEGVECPKKDEYHRRVKENHSPTTNQRGEVYNISIGTRWAYPCSSRYLQIMIQ
jgi:hypothetical protein